MQLIQTLITLLLSVVGQTKYREQITHVGGIKDMKGLPDAIFVIDVKYEKIAVLEAKKMNYFSLKRV